MTYGTSTLSFRRTVTKPYTDHLSREKPVLDSASISVKEKEIATHCIPINAVSTPVPAPQPIPVSNGIPTVQPISPSCNAVFTLLIPVG